MARIVAAYPDAMNEGWRPTPLQGVLRRTVPIHEDSRGSFAELWRDSWTESRSERPFMQSNFSRSAPRVLRGLHFHLRQVDLWVPLEGRAHVTLVDLRARLTGGSEAPITFSDVIGPGEALLIPEGVAHGFWALEPLTLVYLVTNEYDGTDEHGFAWDDVDVVSAWPLVGSSPPPILSERDAQAPSLAEAVARALDARSP